RLCVGPGGGIRRCGAIGPGVRGSGSPDRSVGLGCLLGILGWSDAAKLILRGVEQIVGLVCRPGGGLGHSRSAIDTVSDGARLLPGERYRSATGSHVRRIASYGRCSGPRELAKLFLRGVEQIVGLVCGLGLGPFGCFRLRLFVDGRRLVAIIGLGARDIGLSRLSFSLGRFGLGRFGLGYFDLGSFGLVLQPPDKAAIWIDP